MAPTWRLGANGAARALFTPSRRAAELGINDGYWSRTTVVTYGLWGAVLMELLIAWALVLTGTRSPLPALLMTGVATTGAAVVAHLRGYACGLASLVRIVGRLDGGFDGARLDEPACERPLHPVR